MEMINRGRALIREAIEENLTIQQIADEIGVSYSNFRKLFRACIRASPAVAYQQDLRLQRAQGNALDHQSEASKKLPYRLNFRITRLLLQIQSEDRTETKEFEAESFKRKRQKERGTKKLEVKARTFATNISI